MTDLQALANLTTTTNSDAFADIVRRYSSLVYSTARRLIRDEHLAEDVTQATFVVLIRKARHIDPRFLPGWLVNTTRLTAKAALRSEGRREKREHLRASMQVISERDTDGLNIGEITPILDQALSHLKEMDRTAVVMRFFQGQTFAQIAAAIGVSEEAARKKVSRSLEKMRGVFMRRGFAPSVGGLVVALASHQAKAAPVALVKSIIGAPLPATTSGSAVIAKSAMAAMKWTKIKIAALVALSLGMVVASGELLRHYLQDRYQPPVAMAVDQLDDRGANPPPVPEPVEDTSKYAARTLDLRGRGDVDLHCAKGWPVQLPGEASCTPIVADLLGDGHLEIVVSCRATGNPVKGITDGEPLLFAFRADGTSLPGWPIAVQENDPRKAQNFEWMSSPSVFRRNGKDELVMVGAHAGIIVIKGDGTIKRISEDGKNWHDNIPLADLDGDGIPDIAIGKFVANVDGKHVKGWPPARRFRDGFSSCVGDAFGNGKLEVFHTFYGENTDIGGFDSQGNPLAGWPKNAPYSNGFPPVMGDVLGNGQMQIIAVYGAYLQAWNPDGTPLANTSTVESEQGDGTFANGALDGVLKSRVFAYSASPTLADLDGDGRADIIVFDTVVGAVRAWHGDGSPVYRSSQTLNDNDVAIALGDRLNITVNSRSTAIYDMQPVDHGGNLNIQGIGQVKAAGLTADQLADNLGKLFREKVFGTDARVFLNISHPHLQLDLQPAATTRNSGKRAATRPGQAEDARRYTGEVVRQEDESKLSEVTESWTMPGRPPQQMPQGADGLVALLSRQNVRGISVVSLGDDPRRMDFFAGSYWIDRHPDGSTDVIEMVPGNPAMASVQPTVADVEGNGLADVIFGTSDGVVYVYQTKLAYHADRMQWPTANGNFQHTGAWQSVIEKKTQHTRDLGKRATP